jgi:hypothetical protein
VLGIVKVMSYENLEEAQAKRAEKEAIKEAKGKGKRGWKCTSATPEAEEATVDKTIYGRKRKSAALEAEAPEPKAKVARISKAPEPEPARAFVAQISRTQVTLVARM